MPPATSVSQGPEFGREWQGQVVDGRFPLQQFLGGSENRAVFLTRFAGSESGRAALKLVRANTCDAEEQLAAWRCASNLSHPHLARIFDGGRCWLSGKEFLYVLTEYGDETLAQVLPQR